MSVLVLATTAYPGLGSATEATATPTPTASAAESAARDLLWAGHHLLLWSGSTEVAAEVSTWGTPSSAPAAASSPSTASHGHGFSLHHFSLIVGIASVIAPASGSAATTTPEVAATVEPARGTAAESTSAATPHLWCEFSPSLDLFPFLSRSCTTIVATAVASASVCCVGRPLQGNITVMSIRRPLRKYTMLQKSRSLTEDAFQVMLRLPEQ